MTPPPPDKVAPPRKLLIQEEICSEICQSKEQFTQSLGGFSEVPPPSPFYTSSCCCQASPEHTGETLQPVIYTCTAAVIFNFLRVVLVVLVVFRCLSDACLCFRVNDDGSSALHLHHLHRRSSVLRVKLSLLFDWFRQIICVNTCRQKFKKCKNLLSEIGFNMFSLFPPCRCVLWSATVASTAFMMITTFMCKYRNVSVDLLGKFSTSTISWMQVLETFCSLTDWIKL